MRTPAWSCTSPPLQVVKQQISSRKESKRQLCLAELQLVNIESVLLQNAAQPARARNKELAVRTQHRGADQEGEEQWGGEPKKLLWSIAFTNQSSHDWCLGNNGRKTGFSVFLPLLSCVKPNVLSITFFSSPNHTFRPFLHVVHHISPSQQFLFSTSLSNKFKLPKTAQIILRILCSSDFFFFPLLQENFFQPLK